MYQVNYIDGIQLRVTKGGNYGEIVSRRGTILFDGKIGDCYQWLKDFGAHRRGS